MSLSMSSGADIALCILTANLWSIRVFLTIYTGQGLEQIVVPESLLDRGGNWIEAARTTSPRMCHDDISDYIIHHCYQPHLSILAKSTKERVPRWA